MKVAAEQERHRDDAFPFLALALAEELLQPLSEHDEPAVVEFIYLSRLLGSIFSRCTFTEELPHDGIVKAVFSSEVLSLSFPGASDKGSYIDTCRSDREEASICEH